MDVDLPLPPNKPSRFPLGTCGATPGAIEAMYEAKVDPLTLLVRHVTGDWGDLCDEDKQANEAALLNGDRIFSKYVLDLDDPDTKGDGTSVYVITEWDRSVTTLLTPAEY